MGEHATDFLMPASRRGIAGSKANCFAQGDGTRSLPREQESKTCGTDGFPLPAFAGMTGRIGSGNPAKKKGWRVSLL